MCLVDVNHVLVLGFQKQGVQITGAGDALSYDFMEKMAISWAMTEAAHFCLRRGTDQERRIESFPISKGSFQGDTDLGNDAFCPMMCRPGWKAARR